MDLHTKKSSLIFRNIKTRGTKGKHCVSSSLKRINLTNNVIMWWMCAWWRYFSPRINSCN